MVYIPYQRYNIIQGKGQWGPGGESSGGSLTRSAGSIYGIPYAHQQLVAHVGEFIGERLSSSKKMAKYSTPRTPKRSPKLSRSKFLKAAKKSYKKPPGGVKVSAVSNTMQQGKSRGKIKLVTPRIGGSSYSGGKIYGRRPVKMDRMKEFERQGIVLNLEMGGTALSNDGSQPVYIAHSTAAYWKMAHVAMASLLKRLYIKSGMTINSVQANTAWNGLVGSGTYVELYYQTDPDQAYAAQNFTGVFSQTLMATASAIIDWLAAQTAPQFQLISLRLRVFDSVGDVIKIVEYPLLSAHLSFNVSSHLKIQNRTTSADDDKTDVVDRHPLYGKIYHSYGNFVQDRSGVQMQGAGGRIQWCTSEVTGVTDVQPPALTNAATNQIPPPSQFVSVKSYGKVLLDPGQLKTSSLSYVKTMKVNTFFKEIVALPTATAFSKTKGVSQCQFGKIAIIGLEKMLHETSSAPACAIAYAHNLKIAVIARNKSSQFTDQFTEQYYDV